MQPTAKTIDSSCTFTFLQSVRARLHLDLSKWILWMTHQRKVCVLPARLEGVWNQPPVWSDRQQPDWHSTGRVRGRLNRMDRSMGLKQPTGEETVKLCNFMCHGSFSLRTVSILLQSLSAQNCSTCSKQAENSNAFSELKVLHLQWLDFLIWILMERQHQFNDFRISVIVELLCTV